MDAFPLVRRLAVSVLNRPEPFETTPGRCVARLRRWRWSGVAGLVETDLSAARDPDATHDAPALVAWRFYRFDALGRKISKSCVDVIAHQVQLLGGRTIARVRGEFSGRKREDQPAPSGVGKRIADFVPEEPPDLLGVRGVKDRVDTSDHTADATRGLATWERSSLL
jgi:hypothetical protein